MSADILRDLARAKVAFQMRAIETIIRDPSPCHPGAITMSNTPSHAVEVTQADRDAAAAMLRGWGGGMDTLWAETIKQGERDDHVLVQAFARHRINAVHQALEVGDGL